MPCLHRRDLGIAIVEGIGQYETAELRTAFEAALALFEGDAGGLILDVSASEALAGRSAQDVRVMAYFVASLGDRFARRFAIIAPKDLAFGLMRLGSVVTESEGVMTRVFRERESAMAWLASDTAR